VNLPPFQWRPIDGNNPAAPTPRKIGHLLRWDAKEFDLWWNNGTPNQKEFEDFKKAIKNQRRIGL
jgi:hypothetical protein